VNRRPALFALVAALALGLAACGSSSSSTPSSTTVGKASAASATTLGGANNLITPSEQLNGSGANSIEPFFTKVFYTYTKLNPKVTINYQPSGSSVGISDIQQNIVDFGDSEIPMSSSDLAKATGGPILQVPVDLGGVAISYNVPGIPHGLKLDGPVLAGIFMGTIKDWDDSQIASLNPGVHLPSVPIVPVHRADSSGPGWVLDQYLITTSPTWAATVGTKASKSWPLPSVGVGEQLNTGVANYIAQTSGAVGYVEYGYAKQANFANAAIKNRAGVYLAPSITGISAAGANATNLSPTNFSIVYGPGAATYPLANFSWTLIYQKQASTTKGEVLGKVFDWVTTAGQLQAAALGYAPLPSNVRTLAHQTLLQLESTSGQRIFTQ